MTWHYLPIYTETKAATGETERCYSLIEVYLDKNGKLRSWTEDKVIAAHGNDMDDLIGSLKLQMLDCERWEPVRYYDLKVGMVLKRRGSAEK